MIPQLRVPFLFALALLTSCGAGNTETQKLGKTGQVSRGSNGTPTLVKTLQCRIADASNRNPVNVPPVVQRGEASVTPGFVYFRGHRADVIHQLAEGGEDTARLTLRVDDTVSHVFNATGIDNAQLLGRDYLFQCAFE